MTQTLTPITTRYWIVTIMDFKGNFRNVTVTSNEASNINEAKSIARKQGMYVVYAIAVI